MSPTFNKETYIRNLAIVLGASVAHGSVFFKSLQQLPKVIEAESRCNQIYDKLRQANPDAGLLKVVDMPEHRDAHFELISLMAKAAILLGNSSDEALISACEESVKGREAGP